MSNINHPAHYNSGKIEVIEALEDWKLGPHLFNVVKYCARAGKKDPTKEIEDLEKAQWYLKRKIELLKAEKEGRAITRPNDMNPREPQQHRLGDLHLTGKWISIETEDVGETIETIAFAPDEQHMLRGKSFHNEMIIVPGGL